MSAAKHLKRRRPLILGLFLLGTVFICLLARVSHRLATRTISLIQPEALLPDSQNFPLQEDWQVDIEGVRLLLYEPQNPSLLIVLAHGLWNTQYHVYNARSGALLWNNSSQGLIGERWPRERPINTATQLLFTSDDFVHSIDPRTGEVQWRAPATMPRSMEVTPSMVVVRNNGSMRAFDLATGESRWHQEAGYGSFLYNPLDNRLFNLEDEGLMTLDHADGHQIALLPDPECQLGPEPLFLPGKMYGTWQVCDTSTWEVILRDFSRSHNNFFTPDQPTTYYFRTRHGTVKAFALETDELLWEYTPSAGSNGQTPQLISDIVGVGDAGYAVADDDTIRAFDLTTGVEVGWWRKPFLGDGAFFSRAEVEIRSNGERLFVLFGNRLYSFGMPPEQGQRAP